MLSPFVNIELSKPVSEAHELFTDLFGESSTNGEVRFLSPNLMRLGHKASSFDVLPNSDKERIVKELWDSFSGHHESTDIMFVRQLVSRKSGMLEFIKCYKNEVFAKKFNAREIGDSLTFDQWLFDPAKLDPKSKTMPGKILKHHRHHRNRTISHYGVGFELPSDWPVSPTKMAVYEKHTEQMAESISLTLDTQVQEIAVEGGLSNAYDGKLAGKPFATKKKMLDMLEKHHNRMFCVQKDGTVYDGLENEIWSLLRNNGHEPDSVLLTTDIMAYNNVVNALSIKTMGRLVGDDSVKNIDYTGGDTGYIMQTRHKKLTAIASRPYPVGFGEIRDNTTTMVYVPEKYELTGRQSCGTDHKSSDSTIGILDGDQKCIQEITLIDALASTGIFPATQNITIKSTNRKKMIFNANAPQTSGRRRNKRARNTSSDLSIIKDLFPQFNELLIDETKNSLYKNSLARCYADAGRLEDAVHQMASKFPSFLKMVAVYGKRLFEEHLKPILIKDTHDVMTYPLLATRKLKAAVADNPIADAYINQPYDLVYAVLQLLTLAMNPNHPMVESNCIPDTKNLDDTNNPATLQELITMLSKTASAGCELATVASVGGGGGGGGGGVGKGIGTYIADLSISAKTKMILAFLLLLKPRMDILSSLYEYNFYIPFGTLLFRSWIRFLAGSATFFSRGDASMACVMKECEVMYSNDPDKYVTKVQTRFSAGTVVTNPRSIYCVPGVCATEYKGGAGTRILELFDEDGESELVTNFRAVSDPSKFGFDIVPVLVGADHKSEWFGSITGEIPQSVYEPTADEPTVEHPNLVAVSKMLHLWDRIRRIEKKHTLFGIMGAYLPQAKDQFLHVIGPAKNKVGKEWKDARQGRSALGTRCEVEDFLHICGNGKHYAGTGLQGSTHARPYWGPAASD